MVRIPAFHAGGPGSIPGVGTCFVSLLLKIVPCLELGTLRVNMNIVALRSVHATADGEAERKNHVRRPGVEPGSTAWKATMLTVTPPTLLQLSWCKV